MNYHPHDPVDDPFPARLTAPAPDTHDPARQVGEIFRRLCSASATFSETAFGRIAAAVLAALGRAALAEAESRARHLRLRDEPAKPGIRVSSTAPRLDAHPWDEGDLDL